MSKYSNIGLAFLAGAAAGTLAGILLAPDKGSETRKKIAEKAHDLRETVAAKVKDGLHKANNLKEKFNREHEDVLT